MCTCLVQSPCSNKLRAGSNVYRKESTTKTASHLAYNSSPKSELPLGYGFVHSTFTLRCECRSAKPIFDELTAA